LLDIIDQSTHAGSTIRGAMSYSSIMSPFKSSGLNEVPTEISLHGTV
jgi:hypothetical protein